jgi:3-methyl-2-oxobutanoate hydroxymethyltransferase
VSTQPVSESEQAAPYGDGAASQGAKPAKRVRVHHLRELKDRGQPWPMLTAYDMYTAAIFDEAGIPVLLVGDSAANNVYGHETSLPVTVDELIPLVRAVTRSVKRALVVADLPFGSYQLSPQQAVETSVRFMKEGLAHAVKLEGGRAFAPHVEALTTAGIPVMGHIGFTPQSEHNLGGYRVQGRGEAGGAVLDDALALQEAGAFAVVMEMVPAEVAKNVTHELRVPTIGIGAGPDCDGQVLVWHDLLGINEGRLPRFVKRFADVAGEVRRGLGRYVHEVRAGTYPAEEHSYAISDEELALFESELGERVRAE